jgi:hypothetical protein
VSGKPTRIPLESRLFARIATSGECWLWQSRTNAKGYGEFKVAGKTRRAHRIAWELVAGPIPDGLYVCHTCDNPACCRNDDEGWYEVNGIRRPRRGHLYLGTHADNEADKRAKGRGSRGNHTHPERRARGESQGSAKLTTEKVVRIREQFAGGGISKRALAREYGVCRRTIRLIIQGSAWRHVG